MGRSLVLKTQSNTCRVTPQITVLTYLMYDLENVSQRYLRNDMCMQGHRCDCSGNHSWYALNYPMYKYNPMHSERYL